MKTRMISSIMALIVLFTAVTFFDTLVANVMAAGICGLGTFELLQAKGLTKYKPLTTASVLFSIVMMFVNVHVGIAIMMFVTMIYIAFCFFFLVHRHGKVDIGEICYAIVMTFAATIPLHLMLTIRDTTTAQLGIFYLLITFGSAWWSDTGAYFAGTFFGKHKLCPLVSPKKTVEGLVGGIFAGVLGNLFVASIFSYLSVNMAPLGYFTDKMHINILAICVATPFLSLIGVLGDLVASVIKRQTGIKDFGNIMPGHGGVMDRFDSVVLISPFVYLVYLYFPFATLVQ